VSEVSADGSVRTTNGPTIATMAKIANTIVPVSSLPERSDSPGRRSASAATSPAFIAGAVGTAISS
jgi:hypothetical protein